MALGRLGFNCCQKCGGGGTAPCQCSTYLPDDVQMHFIGDSQLPFLGMDRAQSALINSSVTSRLYKNITKTIDKNVFEYGRHRYSKRIIADVPNKKPSKIWAGCVSHILNDSNIWVQQPLNDQTGKVFWDSDTNNAVYGISDGFDVGLGSDLRHYSANEVSHGDRYSFDTYFPPRFAVLKMPDNGGNNPFQELPSVPTWIPKSLFCALLTQKRNSKLNFNPSNEKVTNPSCNYTTKWGICGWVPKVTYTTPAGSISQFLANNNDSSYGGRTPRQSQTGTITGKLSGFRPSPFFPEAPRTGTTIPIVNGQPSQILDLRWRLGWGFTMGIYSYSPPLTYLNFGLDWNEWVKIPASGAPNGFRWHKAVQAYVSSSSWFAGFLPPNYEFVSGICRDVTGPANYRVYIDRVQGGYQSTGPFPGTMSLTYETV